MNWIKTTYKLPDHKQRVLLYDIRSDIILIGYIYKYSTGDYEFFDLNGNFVNSVTHWAGLQPPKINGDLLCGLQ